MAYENTSLDISELPDPVHRMLAAAINAGRAPIAKRSGGGYVLCGIAGVVTLGVALVMGFGDPASQHSIQGPSTLVWYAFGLTGIVAAVLLRRRKKVLAELLGFPPGIYALGTRMLDARKREIRRFDLLSSDPQVVHHYVNGGYRHTALTWHGFSFTFGSQAAAGEALGRLDAGLRELREAVNANDLALALAIDPMGVGLALVEPKPRSIPAPSRKPLVIGALVIAGLAPPMWYVRNYASTESAFSAIRTIYEAEQWMLHGGDRERGEYKKMQLDLEDAARTHADRADHLIDALRRYPHAPDELKAPVEAMLLARYKKAREASLALSSSSPLTAYINSVYDRLEATRTKATMQVKVARTDNSALAKLDEVVAGDPALKKKIVPVAKYFGVENTGRDIALREAVERGLAQFFPADVMTFTQGDGADGAEHAKIEIFYIIRPRVTDQGPTFYTEVDEQRRPVPGALEYPGIEFELGAKLDMSGKKEAQRVTFTAQPAPSLRVHRYGPRATGLGRDIETSTDHDAVYGAMADSAFADLQQRLVVALGGRTEAP